MGTYEAKVNPELWTNIASQVGATSSAAAAAGMSLFTKAIIGISAASILTTAVIVLSNSDNTATKEEKKAPVSVQVQPESFSTTEPSDVSPTQVNTYKTPESEQPNKPSSTSGGQTNTTNTVATPTIAPSNPFLPPNNTGVGHGPAQKPTQPTVQPTPNPTPPDVVTPPSPADVAPEVKEKEVEFKIALPNIITPNNDDANDFLMLTVGEVNSFYIKVLDQNGKMVFESNDPNFKWDGRNMYTGEPVLKGIHMYYVIAEDLQGKAFKGQEFLMVIPD